MGSSQYDVYSLDGMAGDWQHGDGKKRWTCGGGGRAIEALKVSVHNSGSASVVIHCENMVMCFDHDRFSSSPNGLCEYNVKKKKIPTYIIQGKKLFFKILLKYKDTLYLYLCLFSGFTGAIF